MGICVPPYTVRINTSRKGLMNMMWSWLIEMATGISVQENTDETPCQSSSQCTTTFGSICCPLTQLNKCKTFKSCWPDKVFVREQTVILAAIVSITFWTPLEEKKKTKKRCLIAVFDKSKVKSGPFSQNKVMKKVGISSSILITNHLEDN